MKKTTFFFWLCFLSLLLSGVALAEMSNQEKAEFMESLAKPLKERQIFYRWQSEKNTKTLVEAGEMTPEIYKYFMDKVDPIAGSGLYVAEDISSSSFLYPHHTSLIKVEIEPGYKFLDLMDPEIKVKLEEKGIILDDIYKNNLNPNIAVRDTHAGMDGSWWILKAREGVRFKPFSVQDMSSDELETIFDDSKKINHSFQKKMLVQEAVKTEVLKRVQSDASVFGSSLIEIVTDEYGASYVQRAVNLNKDSLENSDEISGYLKHARLYLQPNDINNLTNKAILRITDLKEGMSVLSIEGLPPLEKTRTVDKIIPLINDTSEAINILRETRKYLEPSDVKRIVDKSLPLIRTAGEGRDILNYGENIWSLQV